VSVRKLIIISKGSYAKNFFQKKVYIKSSTRPALWITVMRMPHVIAVLIDSSIANSIFYVVYLLENQDEIGVDSAV